MYEQLLHVKQQVDVKQQVEAVEAVVNGNTQYVWTTPTHDVKQQVEAAN